MSNNFSNTREILESWRLMKSDEKIISIFVLIFHGIKQIIFLFGWIILVYITYIIIIFVLNIPLEALSTNRRSLFDIFPIVKFK